MGSGWGLIGDSDPSGSTPRTEEVSAIHWFAASRSPKGDGSLATGDRLELPSGGSAAPPAHDLRGASRMSEQTAPNPGTSLRRRARRRRKAGEIGRASCRERV